MTYDLRYDSKINLVLLQTKTQHTFPAFRLRDLHYKTDFHRLWAGASCVVANYVEMFGI